MEKSLIAFLFSFCWIFISFGQNNKKARPSTTSLKTGAQIIKFSPLGLLPAEGLGYPLLSYEIKISKKNSFQLNTVFNYFSDDGGFLNNLGIGAEYRKYFSGNKSQVKSKYLALGIGGNLLTDNLYDGKVIKTTSINAKLVLGLQWRYKEGIILDINGGPQIVNPNFKLNTVPETEHIEGLVPAINISLGYILK